MSLKHFSLFLTMSYFLVACASIVDSKERHRVICRELKSQIVFNGATNDGRLTDMQYSDEALAQRNYNNYDCDHILNSP